MKYSDKHLHDAISNGIFTKDQVEKFKNHIKNTDSRSSELLNVLYYGGGLLVISALTWLMKSSWDSFGAQGITIFSLIYLMSFFIAGYFVYFKNKLIVPGGMLFSIVIAITPLLAFGIMKTFDFWPVNTNYGDYYIWIKGKWVVLEISTFIVGIIILRLTRFPFHMFLIAFTLWFFSMDIVPILMQTDAFTWTDRALVSKIFGVLMLFAAYIFDIKYEKDYSFWLYLFGLITLTSGLSVFYNDETLMLLAFGMIHILMIGVSIVLERNVFLVFGTIGVMEFLSRLSYKYFKDSPMFPFTLTLIGVGLIVLGIVYQKNKSSIEDRIRMMIPKFIFRLKPKRII
ncbi:MAG: DUF2157 domain-containing protein [Spirochaetes bacterium]|jgi:hypothetical protein|nr:DUF2157 domain-containing protein [Spirochaetota bacterium]